MAKVIESAVNAKLAKFTAMVTIDAQRGFAQGRKMYGNVFEIESEAIAALACEKDVTGLVAFDIAAAFPSLCHSFLYQMLHKYDIPVPFINLINGVVQYPLSHAEV